MGKNAKKRKQERKNKAKAFNIEQEKQKSELIEQKIRCKYGIVGSQALPNTANILLKKSEKQCFRLIFDYYNSNLCEINKLNKGKIKKFIELLKRISNSDYIGINNLTKDTVNKNKAEGNYKKLFNNIPDEIDTIEEIKLSDSGRIYFFRISANEQNYACIVTVALNHF